MSVDLHIDATKFLSVSEKFAAAGSNTGHAIRRAVNRAGDMARTQVVRALVGQTGLKRKVIDKAVKATRASFGALSYVMRARGGNVRVQFFGPKERGKGVEAKPWNTSRVYAGAFMKGGFARRVPFKKPGMAGHVWRRTGKAKFPIEQVKSGLYIPDEMVTGASKAAFETTVAQVLPGRLDHELAAILNGSIK